MKHLSRIIALFFLLPPVLVKAQNLDIVVLRRAYLFKTTKNFLR